MFTKMIIRSQHDVEAAHWMMSRRVNECDYVPFNGDYMLLGERDMRF